MRSAELQEAVSHQVLLLSLELPVFPHAVLYQQPLSAAAVVAQGPAGADTVGSGSGGAGAANDIIRFHDPEVSWQLSLHNLAFCTTSCLVQGGS